MFRCCSGILSIDLLAVVQVKMEDWLVVLKNHAEQARVSERELAGGQREGKNSSQQTDFGTGASSDAE